MELIKTDIMKIIKLVLAVGMLVTMYATSRAQDGDQLFRSNCASCHSIGKGKLVGPDLQDVHSRHDDNWLQKWVKSSQSLVKEGDEQAVKLFNDNNKVPMPDVFINEDQIKTVLAYIKTKSSENSLASVSKPPASQGDNSNTNLTPEVKEAGTLLNQFSISEYTLMSLSGLLLIIVWMMSRTIRSLSVELERKYNSDDYL